MIPSALPGIKPESNLEMKIKNWQHWLSNSFLYYTNVFWHRALIRVIYLKSLQGAQSNEKKKKNLATLIELYSLLYQHVLAQGLYLEWRNENLLWLATLVWKWCCMTNWMTDRAYSQGVISYTGAEHMCYSGWPLAAVFVGCSRAIFWPNKGDVAQSNSLSNSKSNRPLSPPGS